MRAGRSLHKQKRRQREMSLYRVVRLIGSSPTSWEEAAKAALEEAAKHLEDLRVAEVEQLDVRMQGNKVVEYRARVRASFLSRQGFRICRAARTGPGPSRTRQAANRLHSGPNAEHDRAGQRAWRSCDQGDARQREACDKRRSVVLIWATALRGLILRPARYDN